MLDSYRKLLEDKAIATIESPGGNLRNPEAAALWLWERLGQKKARQGYSLALVRQIVTEQATIPDGKPIPVTPELQQKFNKLGRVLGKTRERKGE